MSKTVWVVLGVSSLVWAAWCFLVLTTLVPAVLRKLTIYPGMTAWVLCMTPVILGAIILISRTAED